MKWDKVNQYNRMRAHGAEPASGPLSKDALRRQADALLAAGNVPVKKVSAGVRTFGEPDAWRSNPTGAKTLPGKNNSSRASADRPRIANKALKKKWSAPRGNSRLIESIGKEVPAGIVIYADGCCEPNPGVGGWGFTVYQDGVEIHSEHGGEMIATNQTMELTAALRALTWSAESQMSPDVRLFSDSQYTVKGCNEWMPGWKRNGWRRGGPNAKPENGAIANLGLWQALDGALAVTPVTLEWCKGHAGIIGNERADELSLMGRESVLAGQADTRADLIRKQLEYSV